MRLVIASDMIYLSQGFNVWILAMHMHKPPYIDVLEEARAYYTL